MDLYFNWKNIDLNLLVVFSHLYQHRSVSVAAKKSFVSQSAMSHSLSKLRILFDDALFERKGHKMEPTDYAHHIAPTIDTLLNSIQNNLMNKAKFSALDYQGVCRIGLTDYAEYLFAPVLYDAIRKYAPEAQISFINVNKHNYIDIAELENLDLIIGSIPLPDPNFQSQFLYTEKHVCLCNKQLLKGGHSLSVQKFAETKQALVSPDGKLSTKIDNQLAELGLKRQVTVASRNFLTIRRLVEERELIAIVPQRMAKMSSLPDRLEAISPPIDVDDFIISQLWPSKKSTDDKNTWLRNLVSDTIAK